MSIDCICNKLMKEEAIMYTSQVRKQSYSIFRYTNYPATQSTDGTNAVQSSLLGPKRTTLKKLQVTQ